MPELPEVETVMRGLAAKLEGRRIARLSLARTDLRWTVPDGFVQAVAGARVAGFRRRGKYMFMRLDRGVSVLIHLGMSGRMTIDQEPVAHQHLTIETEEGAVIGFVDPRRFGALDLVDTSAEDAHRLIAPLGPEPLEPAFDAAVLGATLAGKATSIKAALLDQSVVAGLGNIYVSEALFRAEISPRRLAGKLGAARVKKLVPAIKATLTEAIAAGGSSLRDYAQPSGELGYFQHAWKVYGRAGAPCERCPGPPACTGIVRSVQSNRATYACPRTQR
ncbi:bifunctional DNA-formamidopyrimidine glycosylase/DNA-(apurinic or apyrimidinic site) lyase [Acidiphilium sp. AL]|uniref:Formamidopyrimidine-DNA glycosylase n=1 Tax=Acidiphilium iwatense TaxID=768198 RepID=A0ABS9DU14_9PROT|nr:MULTISPECIES: bifunctional DNA-formamidopyrimidine glycosylase/DNA-(apurinic or apyrimidinic site) lyase [Acidiphilium]MCF3946217.1 bifunctional DNA-formamidopyrimidine glycosylase/DNA-(apurinic or apyrimidinic site) lyase [Acidiphilium iwatense]MCU4158789.1 bifunctional DNA-formamidopyrimidine glycosylase/DNA-(apurinic or apyrimidinic site) lyase [Acidiphilium sp. AL]